MQKIWAWGASIGLVAAAVGCSKRVENFCNTSTECGVGESCDVSAHECIAGSLTVDQGSFVADADGVWWHPGTGVVLTGTLDATVGTELVLLHGGVQVGAAAVVTGNTWTLAVPDGALPVDARADLIVQLRGEATVEQSLAVFLDTQAAAIVLDPTSSVRDERGDVIAFAVNALPTHQHAGPAVAIGLGPDGCLAPPDIYKHGYLLASGNTDDNPIALRFDLADVAYPAGHEPVLEWRVLRDTVAVRDWTTADTDWAGGAAAVTLDLRRDGEDAIAGLGEFTGAMQLEVRVRDWTAREAADVACWTHHPMAPPLEVHPPTVATLTTAAPLLVLTNAVLTGTAPSPVVVAALSSGSGPFALKEISFTHHTNEPVVVRIARSGARRMYLSGSVWSYWTSTPVAANVLCTHVCLAGSVGCTNDSSQAAQCDNFASSLPSTQVQTTSITPLTLAIDLALYRIEGGVAVPVDDCPQDVNTGEVTCLLPATSTPVSYRVMTRVLGSSNFSPSVGRGWTESTVAGCSSLTSTAMNTQTRCTATTTTTIDNERDTYCTQRTTRRNYHRLRNITWSGDDPAIFEIATALTLAQEPTVPAYHPVDGYPELTDYSWQTGIEDCPAP